MSRQHRRELSSRALLLFTKEAENGGIDRLRAEERLTLPDFL